MQPTFSNKVFRSKCSISCSLELLGDKWTLLIIRDALLLKLTSFNDFRAAPEKIASNILADRLDKLVKNGIMTKSKNQNNKLKFDYTLTEMGLELEPIVMELASWGYKNIPGTNNAIEQARKYLIQKSLL